MRAADDASGGVNPSGVTLHSSWKGIALYSFGAAILVVVSVATVISNGLNLLSGCLAVLAAVAAFAVLFDMPIATTFTSEGARRRTPLRVQRIDWDDVDRLSRARPLSRLPVTKTGLVARRGPRQTMLVDRMEGRAEYDAIRDLFTDDRWFELFSNIDHPPQNRTPTWHFRRKRWHPT